MVSVPVWQGGEYSITTWNYSIRIRGVNPHTVIYFQLAPRHRPSYVFTRFTFRGAILCFKEMNTDTNRIYDDFNPTYLTVTSLSAADPRCQLADDYTVECQGQIKWASPVPSEWGAEFVPDCSSPRPFLDLDYTIAVQHHDYVTCHAIENALSNADTSPGSKQALDACGCHYTHYSEYNMFGLNQADLEFLSTLFVGLTAIGSSCYQHFEEHLCRSVAPKCNEGSIVYPCLEMCYDMQQGCIGTPYISSYLQACDFMRSYHNDSGCVYKPVQCDPDPRPPEHGYVTVTSRAVNSTAEVGCDTGYVLLDNVTVTCAYSGRWEWSVSAECIVDNVTISVTTTETKLDTRRLLAIASAVSVTVLAIAGLVTFLSFRYKYEIVVCLYKHCRCLLCCRRFIAKHEHKEYDALLAYDDDDEHLMRHDIHAELERHGFSVFIDARDGPPNLLPIRYIPEAIARSHCVILNLTPAFLDDPMCQFILDQAFYQSLADSSLRVIILCKQDINELKKLPRYLKSFVRAGCVILRMPDVHLLDKIKYEMRSFEVASPHAAVQNVV